MHFSTSPKEVTEQGKILIYLAKKTAKRIVKTFIFEKNAVVNALFLIPKDTIIKKIR